MFIRMLWVVYGQGTVNKTTLVFQGG